MDDPALHREIILEHYHRPHRRGLSEPFDAEVRRTNPVCGDQVVLRLVLDRGRVGAMSHDALGCAVSQASVSVMGDLVVGLSPVEALAVRRRFVDLLQRHGPARDADADAGAEEGLGDAVAFSGAARHPARVRCALLGWDALADALAEALVRTPADA